MIIHIYGCGDDESIAQNYSGIQSGKTIEKNQPTDSKIIQTWQVKYSTTTKKR